MCLADNGGLCLFKACASSSIICSLCTSHFFYFIFHFSNVSTSPGVCHKGTVIVVLSNVFKPSFLCGSLPQSRPLHRSFERMCLHVCTSVLPMCQTIPLTVFNKAVRCHGVMLPCVVPVHPIQ